MTDEDVLPLWLLRSRFPASAGPYTLHVNGKPATKPSGPDRTEVPRPAEQSIGARTLTTCASCNNTLDRLFEKPAKYIVRGVLGEELQVLDPEQAEIFGRWWVKTLLLLAHPRLVISTPGLHPDTWEPHDPGIYAWLPDGDPPNGFSCWLMRATGSGDEVLGQVELPSVVANSETLTFQVQQFGIEWLAVDLAYHPGWPIQHPLEPDRATRIWPPAGEPLDLRRLEEVGHRAMRWVAGTTIAFADGRFPSDDLPPLGVFGTPHSWAAMARHGILHIRG